MSARRTALTTESVLRLLLDKQSESKDDAQLLLDEQSESKDDADSLSEYRTFVGRVLTDSESEEECVRGSGSSGNQRDGVKTDEDEVEFSCEPNPTSMEENEPVDTSRRRQVTRR